MVSKYELANDLLLPVIRFEVANLLRETYKLKEKEIASRLNITQAAVSKYINGKSGNIAQKIDRIKKQLEANRQMFAKYAENLAANKIKNERQMCELCQKIGGFTCGVYAQKFLTNDK
ncbi:MAG: transcriptional regulator [Candidatus Micrarchaeia archaeon]